MKEKTSCKPEIHIEDGMLIYNKTLIQLRNVSKISIDTVERKKVPVGVIIGFIICFILLCFEDTVGIGLLGALILIIPIFYILTQNLNRNPFIKVSLNSGENVYFCSDDEEFLYVAIDKMISS